MLYLLLSIITASALVLFFKYFAHHNIPVFQAIVFNYWSAAICAAMFLPSKAVIYSANIFTQPWLLLALGLGMLFILIFNLTAVTTAHSGVSTASVASKLGLVFPVIFAFVFYKESFSALKLVGILLAFIAVILSSLQKEEKHNVTGFYALLPFLVFIGSGACDSLTQFANKKYLMNTGIEDFTLMLFVSAAAWGTIVFVYKLLVNGEQFNRQSITGGIILGIANYFSFLFLLKSLSTLSWGSSVIFPLNNLGVVAFSTIAGIVVFKERINRANQIGLLFAAASIVIIVWANIHA